MNVNILLINSDYIYLNGVSLNMKNMFFIVFIFITGFISCCRTIETIDNNITNSPFIKEENILEQTKKSVLKIVSISEVILTNKNNNKSILKEIIIKTGSGSILEQSLSGTFILTAAHVCTVYNEKQINMIFPLIKYSEEFYDLKSNDEYIIVDTNGGKYMAYLLAINYNDDTCILLSEKIFISPLIIINRDIRSAEKSYALGFPLGIWEKYYVPIYSGYYSGLLEFEKGFRSSFSIPSAPGLSGGPIINSEGYIIGMIHSYMSDFNVLSLSATIRQIKSILNEAKEIYATKQSIYDYLISSSSTITPPIYSIQ